MKKKTNFAGKEHDLSGYAALDFSGIDTLSTFARKFADCNPERFEPLALRFFVKNSKPVITLFALDKEKQAEKMLPKRKLPIRKFKLSLSFVDFLKEIKQFDFTVAMNGVDVEQFFIIKK